MIFITRWYAKIFRIKIYNCQNCKKEFLDWGYNIGKIRMESETKCINCFTMEFHFAVQSIIHSND